MALRSRSLFLYNIQVTELNSSIDFRAVSLETPRQATLNLGFYSLSGLATEIVRAMQAVDNLNNYSVTVDRTLSAGTQNRVSISTSGSFLEILFSSGPRAASAVAPLIGFPSIDQTGSTSYQGNASAGTPLITTLSAYNYLGPDVMRKNFGTVNVSSSGRKESIVWQIQKFWQAQFKYEPYAKIVAEWTPFLTWAMQQKSLEFTPEVLNPTVFYEGTLESTSADGKGLAFTLKEMLPEFPDLYDLGMMKFRVNPTSVLFL